MVITGILIGTLVGDGIMVLVTDLMLITVLDGLIGVTITFILETIGGIGTIIITVTTITVLTIEIITTTTDTTITILGITITEKEVQRVILPTQNETLLILKVLTVLIAEVLPLLQILQAEELQAQARQEVRLLFLNTQKVLRVKVQPEDQVPTVEVAQPIKNLQPLPRVLQKRHTHLEEVALVQEAPPTLVQIHIENQVLAATTVTHQAAVAAAQVLRATVLVEDLQAVVLHHQAEALHQEGDKLLKQS